jgi:hypothetical protein
MKKPILIISLLISIIPSAAQSIFSIQGDKTMINDNPFQIIGLRCSNALLNDETTDELVEHLDKYLEYGINTISVYFMGSRYSNINGFHLDGTIKKDYGDRMAKIIRACNERDMVVLVGILYWGAQMGDLHNAYYKDWQQEDVNEVMRQTIQWLSENKFRNVFVDPDNEGMAERGMDFNIDEMICEGKKIDAEIPIAYNGRGYPPSCADLSIHFGRIAQGMPYIESEGTPNQYWGEYSKERGLDHYINVGIYTESKKLQQINRTKELLDAGHGYMFASTFLMRSKKDFALEYNG